METPQHLKQWLIEVFPSFEKEWDEDEPCSSLHQVLATFTPFFGSNQQSFTSQQLTLLADFINKAVLENDDLENAISTCFLEHLHQVNAQKALKPHLGKVARSKMHA